MLDDYLDFFVTAIGIGLAIMSLVGISYSIALLGQLILL